MIVQIRVGQFAATFGLLAGCLLAGASSAWAADCPGNPEALGTSRVQTVSSADYPRVGIMQYRTTIPLADKEVVLTFDDGPLPPYTTRVLETLKSECVRATFFIVGRMARSNPSWVRRIHEEGHTVATHSQNHPLIFPKLTREKGIGEIEDGFASTIAAMGDPKLVAPWFRFPGLGRTVAFEKHLASTGRSVWSAEIVGDDWLQITDQQVMDRTLQRIEERGRGIVLLHDIQARTALMLPRFLKELKRRGYRIVHLVPAETAATASLQPGPAVPAAAPADPMKQPWPRLPDPASAPSATPVPAPAAAQPPATLSPTPTAQVPTAQAPAAVPSSAAPRVILPAPATARSGTGPTGTVAPAAGTPAGSFEDRAAPYTTLFPGQFDKMRGKVD
jgi:peptidoglycan/xylan/chitin deacetylase (PgdA/CDA1 family)